jgi:DNA-binding NarL/FixJ family response regulator
LGTIKKYYQISRTAKLQETIELLHKNKFDVILLDLSLPDAKDIKALVAIRELFPDIPIIILSDQSDELTIQRTMIKGASSFLTKSEASGVLIRKKIDDVIKNTIKTVELV